MPTNSDKLQFLEDQPEPDTVNVVPWRLMVIDDEADVHRATEFALTGVKILGRPLQILNAYSAAEAAILLESNRDVAVILLDVVMEREDSGLTLVKLIREELKLKDLRIILRTGQAGYAPEIRTIQEYDINDYKTKSELTRSRLFATVTTALRSYEQILKLDSLAFYDRLTGLPNRNLFIELSEKKLSTKEVPDAVIGVLDLDAFSEFNNALGYQIGDLLLNAVAQRLRHHLDDSVVLARIGGDTFGVMGNQHQIADKFLASLFLAPFDLQGNSFLVTASVGMARPFGPNNSVIEALKEANIALKKAKSFCRGSCSHYSEEMGADILARVSLLQKLRAALGTDQLFLVYQPQIDLNTQKVFGVEALLRLKLPDGSFVPPSQFIPLAEASGMIVSLDEWVLRKACTDLIEIQGWGFKDLRMSVNVSQIQFRHLNFIDMLSSVLEDTKVSPGFLELEITESTAMDDAARVFSTLEKVRKLGVTVAIDDFGTGYSSLGLLSQLPVDRLKIDRTFVIELAKIKSSEFIATLITELGRNLKIAVLAEGIEGEHQAQCLKNMGCSEGQGFLFAPALTLAELKQWLNTRNQ